MGAGFGHGTHRPPQPMWQHLLELGQRPSTRLLDPRDPPSGLSTTWPPPPRRRGAAVAASRPLRAGSSPSLRTTASTGWPELAQPSDVGADRAAAHAEALGHPRPAWDAGPRQMKQDRAFWRDRVLAESAVASQGLWTLRSACAVCEVAQEADCAPGPTVNRRVLYRVKTAWWRVGSTVYAISGYDPRNLWGHLLRKAPTAPAGSGRSLHPFGNSAATPPHRRCPARSSHPGFRPRRDADLVGLG